MDTTRFKAFWVRTARTLVAFAIPVVVAFVLDKTNWVAMGMDETYAIILTGIIGSVLAGLDKARRFTPAVADDTAGV